MNSWVNRTSSWFAQQYPEATIETVNAGVSETQTSLAIYRLDKHLMNTNGHDMPDLVFVEFTSNDDGKIYTDEQQKEHIESLIHNIRKHNPCAEIVVVSTNKNYWASSISNYKTVCQHYGIPFINVGEKMAEAIYNNTGSTSSESSGNYRYTVDNLHPSAEGYGIYFNEIKTYLEDKLNFTLQSDKIYDYAKNSVGSISTNIITNPQIITADKFSYSDSATLIVEDITYPMFQTSTELSNVKVADSYLDVAKDSIISADFTGNTLGLFLKFVQTDYQSVEYTLKYRVDDGDWKDYTITRKFSHTVEYMLEYELSSGNHTVEIQFTSDALPYVAGLFVNG